MLAPLATMSYDPGMRLTQRTLGNGLDVTRAYRDDPLSDQRDNLLASITVETAPGLADRPGLSLSYTYDANRNMTAEDMGGVMDPYGTDLVQDAKDRMTAWTRDTTATSLDAQTWSLSFEHNWDSTTTTDSATNTTQSRTHSAVHELLTIDPDSDPSTANELAQTHDAKGNLSNDAQGRVFTHDFDNMLQSVTVSPGSAQGVAGTHTYTYDAMGRRVSKTTNGTTTVFICSGGQVMAEYVAGTSAATPQRKYVYGNYIDEPIALIDATSTSGGEETYYYHRNRQYSIIALTDSSGAVVERYAYTAYGKPTILAPDGITERTTSDYNNAYLHTGRRYDDESALYYYRARYYSPTLGQFLQRDSLGYPDGLNTYAAYHVMHGGVDPMGMRWQFLGDGVTGDNAGEYSGGGEEWECDPEWKKSSCCYDYCGAAGGTDEQCDLCCNAPDKPNPLVKDCEIELLTTVVERVGIKFGRHSRIEITWIENGAISKQKTLDFGPEIRPSLLMFRKIGKFGIPGPIAEHRAFRGRIVLGVKDGAATGKHEDIFKFKGWSKCDKVLSNAKKIDAKGYLYTTGGANSNWSANKALKDSGINANKPAGAVGWDADTPQTWSEFTDEWEIVGPSPI